MQLLALAALVALPVSVQGGWAVTSVTNAYQQTATADVKSAAVWSKVLADNGKSATWPSAFSLAYLFIEPMTSNVNQAADEFGTDAYTYGISPFSYTQYVQRAKPIHSVGVIAKCQFVWNQAVIKSLGYTGLFTGASANYGFIRASSATQPDFTQSSATSGAFVGGMGFKFMRNGVPSANFVAMKQLTAWDSWNFFKYTLTNHISAQHLSVATTLIAEKFKTVSGSPNMVGLSDFATYDNAGIKYANPQFPFQLLFQPNATLQTMYPDTATSANNYFNAFQNDVQPGNVLYTIMAINNPFEAPVIIGQVVIQSAFKTSIYADQTMFLQHQTIESDFAAVTPVSKQTAWKAKCPDVYHCAACNINVASATTTLALQQDQWCGTPTLTYDPVINAKNSGLDPNGAATPTSSVTLTIYANAADNTTALAPPSPVGSGDLTPVIGGAVGGLVAGLLVGVIGMLIVKRRSAPANSVNRV